MGAISTHVVGRCWVLLGVMVVAACVVLAITTVL